MSKSSMLKEGMKGGLNGLLSSTKKPSKEDEVPRHQERDVLA